MKYCLLYLGFSAHHATSVAIEYTSGTVIGVTVGDVREEEMTGRSTSMEKVLTTRVMEEYTAPKFASRRSSQTQAAFWSSYSASKYIIHNKHCNISILHTKCHDDLVISEWRYWIGKQDESIIAV